MWFRFICFAIPVLILSCSDGDPTESPEPHLFTLLDSEKSGINFENTVIDNENANIFLYETFYNGGGVAIGDINNDGLQDIYFAGNQKDDQLYLNLGDLKFKNITKSAGILNRGGWSTGVVFADVNNDGLVDIYVSKSLYDDKPGLRVNELYINQGNNSFKEEAEKYGLDDSNRTMNSTFFDFDKDGDLDVFMVNQPPNPAILSKLHGNDWLDTTFTCRLYENNEGVYRDISASAGVNKRGYGLSATVSDFNRDGWPDIYVCNDYDSPDMMYINQGDGTFINEINKYVMHISNFSMGSDVADIDNDGYFDFVALDMVAEDNFRLKANMSGMNPENFWRIYNAGGHRQYMFNTFQLNNGTDPNGDLVFSEIGQMMGISTTDWSWTPLIADFDNDGKKDLFVTNGIKRDLRNTDAVKRSDKVIKKKLGPVARRNNGLKNVNVWNHITVGELLDLLPSQKLMNYIFKNEGNYKFNNVAENWGLNQLTFSSGAAYADLDNDGDLDLVVNNVDDKAFIYRNNSETRNSNYIRIKLEEEGKPFNLFGTVVEVIHGDNSQYFEFTNARGFYSSSENIAHFGLNDSIDKVDIKVIWPNGKASHLKDVKTRNVITADLSNATQVQNESKSADYLFTDVTKDVNVNFRHTENIFDDYEREVLLPHKMSQFGPALTIGDVNGDGLEDFYIGAAMNLHGWIYLQTPEGTFEKSFQKVFDTDRSHEDVGAVFFDADGDNDLDLYVVSGGNEYDPKDEYYQDRLYINDGKGNFIKGNLPELLESGSRVIPGDFDNDGDIDLFVGGRQVPGQYPEPASSFLLENLTTERDKPVFEVVNDTKAPALNKLGMVTDAVWDDFDNDGDLDLIISGVWMPVTVLENTGGSFENITKKLGLDQHVGWWFSITPADVNNDGKTDFIAGNLGLNYKYKASYEEPFTVHFDDFDDNGSEDIVLGYFNFGSHFPLRGRSCSSQQIPSLQEKFPSYTSFASATIDEVYGEEMLENALKYEARTFASSVYINTGSGFEIRELPARAQFSSINDVISDDIDGDGNIDLIIAGNLFTSEIETPRADASVGLLLKGDGKGNFNEILPHNSGLFLKYDVKNMGVVEGNNQKYLIAGCNNDDLRIIEYSTR